MKMLWRWLRWPLFAFCALVGLIVALQLLYVLLPEPALSAESKRMQEAAAPHFVANDAGYYALGLLAPEGVEPIVYGKCRAEVLAAQQAELNALPAGSEESGDKLKPILDRFADQEIACLQGFPKLEIKRVSSKGELQWEDVVALAEPGRIPATFEKRVDWLASMGLAGYDPAISMLVLGSRDLSALTDLANFYSADGALRWERGDKISAISAFSKSSGYANSLLGGSLLDLMIANAIHARQLRMIQHLVARSPALTQKDSVQLNEIVNKTSLLPESLVNALAHEHTFSQTQWINIFSGRPRSNGSLHNFALKLPSINRMVNQYAVAVSHSLSRTRTAPAALTYSKSSAPIATSHVCGRVGQLELLCILFFPDPLGYVLTAIATPNYADYSVRLYQTGMLANAVRLTIAAKEKNLAGDGLLQFANSVPANMRNPFTEAPFSIDAQKRTLTMPIYVKGGAIGNGNTLTLPM